MCILYPAIRSRDDDFQVVANNKKDKGEPKRGLCGRQSRYDPPVSFLRTHMPPDEPTARASSLLQLR